MNRFFSFVIGVSLLGAGVFWLPVEGNEVGCGVINGELEGSRLVFIEPCDGALLSGQGNGFGYHLKSGELVYMPGGNSYLPVSESGVVSGGWYAADMALIPAADPDSVWLFRTEREVFGSDPVRLTAGVLSIPAGAETSGNVYTVSLEGKHFPGSSAFKINKGEPVAVLLDKSLGALEFVRLGHSGSRSQSPVTRVHVDHDTMLFGAGASGLKLAYDTDGSGALYILSELKSGTGRQSEIHGLALMRFHPDRTLDWIKHLPFTLPRYINSQLHIISGGCLVAGETDEGTRIARINRTGQVEWDKSTPVSIRDLAEIRATGDVVALGIRTEIQGLRVLYEFSISLYSRDGVLKTSRTIFPEDGGSQFESSYGYEFVGGPLGESIIEGDYFQVSVVAVSNSFARRNVFGGFDKSLNSFGWIGASAENFPSMGRTMEKVFLSVSHPQSSAQALLEIPGNLKGDIQSPAGSEVSHYGIRTGLSQVPADLKDAGVSESLDLILEFSEGEMASESGVSELAATRVVQMPISGNTSLPAYISDEACHDQPEGHFINSQISPFCPLSIWGETVISSLALSGSGHISGYLTTSGHDDYSGVMALTGPDGELEDVFICPDGHLIPGQTIGEFFAVQRGLQNGLSIGRYTKSRDGLNSIYEKLVDMDSLVYRMIAGGEPGTLTCVTGSGNRLSLFSLDGSGRMETHTRLEHPALEFIDVGSSDDLPVIEIHNRPSLDTGGLYISISSNRALHTQTDDNFVVILHVGRGGEAVGAVRIPLIGEEVYTVQPHQKGIVIHTYNPAGHQSRLIFLDTNLEIQAGYECSPCQFDNEHLPFPVQQVDGSITFVAADNTGAEQSILVYHKFDEQGRLIGAESWGMTGAGGVVPGQQLASDGSIIMTGRLADDIPFLGFADIHSESSGLTVHSLESLQGQHAMSLHTWQDEVLLASGIKGPGKSLTQFSLVPVGIINQPSGATCFNAPSLEGRPHSDQPIYKESAITIHSVESEMEIENRPIPGLQNTRIRLVRTSLNLQPICDPVPHPVPEISIGNDSGDVKISLSQTDPGYVYRLIYLETLDSIPVEKVVVSGNGAPFSHQVNEPGFYYFTVSPGGE